MPSLAETDAPLTRQGRKSMVHPAQIKALIEMAGSSSKKIANDLAVSESVVSRVIYGTVTSRRIALHIAKVAGQSIHKLWPGRYPKDTKHPAPAKAKGGPRKLPQASGG